jgi:hypothetical protein
MTKQIITFGETSIATLIEGIKLMARNATEAEIGIIADLKKTQEAGTEFVTCSQKNQAGRQWVKIGVRAPSYTAYTVKMGEGFGDYIFQTVPGNEPEWVQDEPILPANLPANLPEMPEGGDTGLGPQKALQVMVTWAGNMRPTRSGNVSLREWMSDEVIHLSGTGMAAELRKLLVAAHHGKALTKELVSTALVKGSEQALLNAGISADKVRLIMIGMAEVMGKEASAAPVPATPITDTIRVVGDQRKEMVEPTPPTEVPAEEAPPVPAVAQPAVKEEVPGGHVFRTEVMELVMSSKPPVKLVRSAQSLLKDASPCEEGLIRQWAERKGVVLEREAISLTEG